MSNDQFATPGNPLRDNRAMALGSVGLVAKKRSALLNRQLGKPLEPTASLRRGEVCREDRHELGPSAGPCRLSAWLGVPEFTQVNVADACAGQTLGQSGLRETSPARCSDSAHVDHEFYSSGSQRGVEGLRSAAFITNGE